MTVTLPQPDPDTEARAAAIFEALDQARVLAEPAAAATPPAIAPTRLYAFALAADAAADPALAARLARDEAVGRAFAALLARLAYVRFPALAAAAAGALRVRTAGPHRIRFEPSRAEPTQTYVVIELAPGTEAPQSLFVCSEGWRTHKAALPPAPRQVIQLLYANDDPLLVALLDPAAEVFLR
ncbi:MAG: hypothetical protein FJX61_14180 [Alphaproteobacteria bacterium]|nr:hypothetical protein [Alphaproteobacteria bacterium]